jgi:FkbM family methyltransferase
MPSLWRRLFGGGREPSYALNQLDHRMLPWLDFRGGFFIEAGANDGLAQSNTLFFERHRGWKGLLVEPVPELAQRCRANRPACIVENCALVAADDGRREVAMTFCNLMSLVQGAMQSPDADRAHVERGEAVQPGVASYELMVPARTLDDILAAHGIDTVDLLSLDVEGYEVPALRGLKRVKPRFMLIEARDRPAIEAELSKDYAVLAELSHHDVLFGRRS